MNTFIVVWLCVHFGSGESTFGFIGQIVDKDVQFSPSNRLKNLNNVLNSFFANKDGSFYNYDVYNKISKRLSVPKEGIYYLYANIIITSTKENFVEVLWHRRNEESHSFCRNVESLPKNTSRTLVSSCFVRFQGKETVQLSIFNTADLSVLIGTTVGIQLVGDIGTTPGFSLPVQNTSLKVNKTYKKSAEYFNSLPDLESLQNISIPISGLYTISLNLMFKSTLESAFSLVLNSHIVVSEFTSIDSSTQNIVVTKSLQLNEEDYLTMNIKSMELLEHCLYSVVLVNSRDDSCKGFFISLPETYVDYSDIRKSQRYFLPFYQLKTDNLLPPFYFNQSNFKVGEMLNDPKLLTQNYGLFMVSLSIVLSASIQDTFVVLHSRSATERQSIGLSGGLSTYHRTPVKNNSFSLELRGMLQLRKNSFLSVTIHSPSSFRILKNSFLSLTRVNRRALTLHSHFRKADNELLNCRSKWVPFKNLNTVSDNSLRSLISEKRDRLVITTFGVYLINARMLVKPIGKRIQSVQVLLVRKGTDRSSETISVTTRMKSDTNELTVLQLMKLRKGDELQLMVMCNNTLRLLDNVRFEVSFLKYNEEADYLIASKDLELSKWQTHSDGLHFRERDILPTVSGVYFVSLSLDIEYSDLDYEFLEASIHLFQGDFESGLSSVFHLKTAEMGSRGVFTANVYGFMKLTNTQTIKINVKTEIPQHEVNEDFSIDDISFFNLRPTHRRISLICFSKKPPLPTYGFKSLVKSDKVFWFTNNKNTLENFEGSFLFKTTIFIGPYLVVDRPMFVMYDVSIHLQDVIGEFSLCFRIRPRKELVFLSSVRVFERKTSATLSAVGVVNLVIGETVQLIVYAEKTKGIVLCTKRSWSMVELVSPTPIKPVVIDNYQNENSNIALANGTYLQLDFDGANKEKPSSVTFVRSREENNIKTNKLSGTTKFYPINHNYRQLFKLETKLTDQINVPFLYVYPSQSSKGCILTLFSLAFSEDKSPNTIYIYVRNVSTFENIIYEGPVRDRLMLLLCLLSEDHIQISNQPITNDSSKFRQRRRSQNVPKASIELLPIKFLCNIEGMASELTADYQVAFQGLSGRIGNWRTSNEPFFENTVGFKDNSSIYFVQEHGYYLINIVLEFKNAESCSTHLMVEESSYQISNLPYTQFTNVLWLERGMTVHIRIECSSPSVVVRKFSSFSIVLYASQGSCYDKDTAGIISNIKAPHFYVEIATNDYLTCEHPSKLLSNFQWIRNGKVVYTVTNSRNATLRLLSITNALDGFYQCVMTRGKRVTKTPLSFLKVLDPRPTIKVFNETITIGENYETSTFVTWVKIHSVGLKSNMPGPVRMSVESGDASRNFYFEPEVSSSFTSMFYKRPFDYETKREYRLVLKAVKLNYNGAAGVKRMNLTIRIADRNDHPPVFVTQEDAFSVKENSPVDTYVARVLAADVDQDTLIRYGLVEKTSLSQKIFKIDPVSGVISTASSIDYEEKREYYLMVTASDGLFTTFMQIRVAVIDLNDNKPRFTKFYYTINISLTTSAGAHIMRLNAYDADTEKNGALHFTIKTGNSFDYFEIDRDEIILLRPLTEERTFTLGIKVVDGAGLQCDRNAQVTIYVTDNSYKSKFMFERIKYDIQLLENIVGTKRVVRLHINSKLTGDKSEIKYAISAFGRHSAKDFYVTKDGVLMTNASFDYEKFKEERIIVRGCAVEKKLCGIAQVNITIVDANDNRPLFTRESYSAVVKENLEVGDVVVKVTAVDKDSKENGRIFYSLYNYRNMFSVDATSGELVLMNALNASLENYYDVTIEARDNGRPIMFDFCKVNVTVLPLNLTPVAGKVNSETSVSFDSYILLVAREYWYVLLVGGVCLILILSICLCIILQVKYKRQRRLVKTIIRKLPTVEEMEINGYLKYTMKPAESVEAELFMSCETLPSAYKSNRHLTEMKELLISSGSSVSNWKDSTVDSFDDEGTLSSRLSNDDLVCIGSAEYDQLMKQGGSEFYC